VVAIGKDHVKASGRSVPGFNLIAAIRSIKDDLLNHGGHEQAAGFTAKVNKLPDIKIKLMKLVEEQIEVTPPTQLSVESLIDFDGINWQLLKEISRFEPFGMANPEPVFAAKGVVVVDKRIVGQDQRHLKLKLKQKGKVFDAIAFGQGHLAKDLKQGNLIDVAFTIEVNQFNGIKSLQLKIKDLKLP
jgi:single-stranded-DNA-specific exonuclease